MILPNLVTITIERRGYGRRYSELPVDHIDRDSFTIDCTNAYVRPEQYDFRSADIVRWRSGERVLEATIAKVERSEDRIRVTLQYTHPLPEDFFYY